MIDVLCVTSKLSVGGVQTFLINNVEPLLRQGVRLNFVVDTDEPQIYDEYVRSQGCRIFRVSSLNNSKIKFIRDLRSILKKNPEIRIVHSHRNFANLYSFVATIGLCKSISHAHNNYKPKSLLNKMLKGVFKMMLPIFADEYWACSEESAKWLYGRFSTSKKCRVIKNAVSTKRFRYDESARYSVRHNLNIDNKYVWIHVGTLSPAKNHKFLLELFAESVKNDANQHLLLCGDGVLRADIEKQIKQLQLENKVTMLGNVNNAQDYLSSADCYIFPSIHEGFPLSVIEAQANGIFGIVSQAVPESCVINQNILRLSSLTIDSYLNSIEKLKTIEFDRVTGADNVKISGFDIETEAVKIADYYKAILNQ